MINKLDSCNLSCNEYSVYTYGGLTVQELLCQFFTKINECIEVSNESLDFLKWLKEIGLPQEVINQLNVWLNDGTLADLINTEIFKDLNDKIDNNTLSIDEIFKMIEEGLVDLPVYESVVADTKSLGTLKREYLEYKKLNEGKTVIRVGSFNILEFRRRNITSLCKASYLMLGEKLDVCGVQEYVNQYLFNSESVKNPILNNMKYLELLNVNGGNAGSAILYSDGMIGYDYGYYTKVEGYEKRGWGCVTMNVNGKSVKVYNTHLTHNNGSLNLDEMRELAKIVEQDNTEYKIVVGDFNNNDVNAYSPFTTMGYDFAIPLSTGTIDNILVPSNMKINYSKVVPTSVDISDHKLVVAELEGR